MMLPPLDLLSLVARRSLWCPGTPALEFAATMWLIEGLPALWAGPDSDVRALIGCGKRVCELSGCPPAIHSQSVPRARGCGRSDTGAGLRRGAPEARGGALRRGWDVCSVARAWDSRAHEPPPRQARLRVGGA